MARGRKKSTPLDVPQLEELLEQVQSERRLRLDIRRMDNMVQRPFRRRPRPKTAIISQAAKAATEVSEWLNAAQANNETSEATP